VSVDARLADLTVLVLAAKRCQARQQVPDWRASEGLASLLDVARRLPQREPFALPDLEECTGMERLLAEARQKGGPHGA
jgi:hypothetical protein